MSAEEAAFLFLVLSGVLALLGGILWTRSNWRSDAPPYGRHTRCLDVTLHPERYARDYSLRVIRTLSLAGALLLAGARGILAHQAFLDFSGRE